MILIFSNLIKNQKQLFLKLQRTKQQKMDTQLSCPLCASQYSDQKLPRLLVMCGHTFCQSCIETIILPKGQDKFKVVCPQDGTASQLANNAVSQFPKNLALLKVIQSNKSKSSFKDSSFDVSKIVKQEQMQQDEDTKQLITAIKQSQQSQQNDHDLNQQESDLRFSEMQNPTNQQEENQQIQDQQNLSQGQDDQNMCLLHQKPLDVVCVVDLQRICAKCAIFGQHKGHDFKSIQQIHQQTDQFNSSLIAVYDDKSEILKRIQSKSTKPDLLSILNQKKQTYSKQIKDRFKKLTDVIKNEQKKALTKLQKIAQKTQKDIDDLYKIDSESLQKYQEWERLSYEKLQIIESGTFEQKLHLLLIDQAKSDQNIILKGTKIVQQIKNQQVHIINKFQAYLSNINIRNNDGIFDFTQNFVEVLDKPYETPKTHAVKIVTQKTIKSIADSALIQDSGKKHSEDDLLEHDQLNYNDHEQKTALSSFQISKTVQNIKIQDIKLQSKVQLQNSNKKEIRKHTSVIVPVEQLQLNFEKNFEKTAQLSQSTSRDNSFITQKPRPTKKKLKSIKVPQKYQKVLQTLFNDSIDTLDLTNGQLGDGVILQICQFIPGTKIKTIKFIRNKLNDQCIGKMLPFLTGVITINLSQNLLTEKVLQIFIKNREMLPKVKNIILSLNKIIQRKHKPLIDQLRKLDITVSI